MYIGIDLGTSSVKCLLMNKAGKIINTATREYELLLPKPGWSEQDPSLWLNGAMECLKEVVIGNESKIKSFSFSGQMHGLVILDSQDEVIRPAILWNDQRTADECDYLNNVIGIEKLSKWTANMALTGFTAPKVLWVKNNEPENFKRITKMMLPKDYIAYKLSGVFASDVSDSSGTLYFDVENRKWSEEMLEVLGVSSDMLPEVFESYEKIGTLKESIATELGLTNDICIVIGGGDNAVGAIGTGTVTNNSASVSLGTSGVIFVNSDKFVVDDNNALHAFGNAIGAYHLMGVTLNAAGSLKWWTDKQNPDKDVVGLLDEVKTTKIDDTVYFLPYLLGERTPINDPLARGMFFGFELSHERAHFTRAVIEGVTFSLRDCFSIVNDLGLNVKTVRATGGGAKSDLWLQMIADVLNVEVEIINTTDGPALGAAILAAVGCGDYSSVDEACKKIIGVTKTIKPIVENVKLYDKKFSVYKELYPAVKELYKKL